MMGYLSDTRVLYKRPNTIVVAPLFSGTGQRVKLLEAFSMAMPVVTTSIGALGFPISNGVEAFIANTPDEFRSAFASLQESCELRREMGCRAREMILEGFDWQSLGGQYCDAVMPAGGEPREIPVETGSGTNGIRDST
jgi:glycosyltransferase involved in cell wall biosynthesis